MVHLYSTESLLRAKSKGILIYRLENRYKFQNQWWEVLHPLLESFPEQLWILSLSQEKPVVGE